MAKLTPRQLLTQAREANLDTEVPPIAVEATLIDGYHADDPRTLQEPSMLLTPVPHPIFEAFMTTSGATRRGRLTWVVGMGRETFNPAPLIVVRDRLQRGTLYTEGTAATSKSPKDLANVAAATAHTALINHFAGGTAAGVMSRNALERVANAAHPQTGPGKFGAVTVSGDHGMTYIKVVTHQLTVPEHLPQIALNLRPAGKPFTDPRPVRPADAMAVLEWLMEQGVHINDPSENNDVAVIRRKLSTSIVAYPTPGRPALAETAIGRKVFAQASDILGGNVPFEEPGNKSATTRGRLSAQQVMSLVHAMPEANAVHPGTVDVGNLAHATPVDDERLRPYQKEAVGLHIATDIGYLQCSAPGMGKTVMAYGGMERRAARTPGYRGLVVAEANVRAQWVSEADDWFPGADVIRIESRDDAPKLARAMANTDRPVVAVISYGLLPAVSTEMARREALAEAGIADPVATAGTPQTLEADPGAEASGDWEDMLPGVDAAITDRREPGTTVFADVPLSKAAQDMGQFDLFAMLTDDAPATQPASVATPETPEEEEEETVDPFADVDLGALLLDQTWHDIIADEAEVLRGTGSKMAAALWKLRMNSQVALALTGTPINKGVDDLGRLMSWVRGDVHLFHGVRLSEQFDLNTDEGLAAFTEAMGPLLFRRDTSEIADELPQITPVVMKLTPSAAEKALAGAARAELKRVYEELLSAIELAEELSEDEEQSEALAEAKERLTEARGAWLGGTTLARMASSDPAALLGSTSAGAALLAGQGLIEAATAQAGTKRTAVVADVTTRVANGEKVLIFTEFATVARGVIDDLDAAGVRVGAVLGGGGRKRDAMVAGFQRGDLDVLVCTSSGERGLNLQQATTIVHYDLPWTPKGVIQRTGRAMRIKSQNSKVTVVFPLMEGTIEERVAAMVVTRAVEAMRALDVSRGVDASKTEMGQALGGLVTALDDTATGRTGNAAMDMTAALVAA